MDKNTIKWREELTLKSDLATCLCFSIGDGGWAFDGIEMTNMAENDDGQMVISCMSTHLTSFAVLVDVAGTLSVSCLEINS